MLYVIEFYLKHNFHCTNYDSYLISEIIKQDKFCKVKQYLFRAFKNYTSNSIIFFYIIEIIFIYV